MKKAKSATKDNSAPENSCKPSAHSSVVQEAQQDQVTPPANGLPEVIDIDALKKVDAPRKKPQATKSLRDLDETALKEQIGKWWVSYQ